MAKMKNAARICSALMLLCLLSVEASHFRYMSISWINRGNRLVTFFIEQGWRYDYGLWGSATIGVNLCTDASMTFGDGTAAVTLCPTPTEIDTSAGEDWFLGTITLNHTFSGTANQFVVKMASYARINSLADCNGGQYFQVETGVDLTRTQSPKITGIPIFFAYYNSPLSYTVPVQNSQPVTWLFTPSGYTAGNNNQSGLTTQKPTGMNLNYNTGLLTWTPTSSVNPNPSQCLSAVDTTKPLFAVQIQCRESLTNYVTLDFIFKVQTLSANSPPTTPRIQPSPVSNVVYASYGSEVSFTVQSMDPFQSAYTNGIAIITNVLPTGSTFSGCAEGQSASNPSFSAGSNCTRTFRWTPQLGQSTTDVLFYAKDPQGLASDTVRVTINVTNSRFLYLSGILRTFPAGGDFGVNAGDVGNRLVATTIGANGYPVYSPASTPTTVSSATSFNNWWAGSGSVYSLTLSQLTPTSSVFSFNSGSFFPAGTDTPYFTYAINTYITYKGGESFSFTSRDDLWIFVNGVLRLDNGGVKSASDVSTKTLNLDNLNLVVGNTYSYDIFYAHRGSASTPSTQIQSTDAVQCSVLGSGVTSLSYKPFSSLGGINLVNAPGIVSNTLQLSDNTNSDFAYAAWATTLQRVLNGFQSDFTFRIVKSTNTLRAHGFAFVLQRQDTTSVGGTGANLGYAGIKNSIAIEFDCFSDPANGDPASYHVSVHTRYASANNAQETYSLGNASVSVTMDDGLNHNVSIQYVPAASSATVALGWIRVYLDNMVVPVLSAQVNDLSLQSMFSGAAYVGFTAANGGRNLVVNSVTQDFLASVFINQWTFAVVPPSASWTSPTQSPPGTIIAGTGSSVTVQARDACRNTITLGGDSSSFSYQLVHSDGVTKYIPTAQDITDSGNGQYILAYNPTKAGTWTLSISFLGSPINGNPWSVLVIPGPTAAAQSKFTPNPLPTASAGSLYSFTIQAADAYGNSRTLGGDAFSVVFSSTAFATTFTDNSNGRYTVTYNGTAPGTFQVSITLATGNIAGSPASLTVIPGPANAWRSVPGGSGYFSGNVDNSNSFFVTPVDVFGNIISTQGSDALSATLTGPSSASCTMTWDSNNKRWVCSYSVTVSGTYTTVLTVNGATFATGAGPAVSAGAAVASKSVVFSVNGQSPLRANQTAGEAVTVVVQSRDQYSNVRSVSAAFAFTISLTPLGAISVLSTTTFTDNNNGYYQLTYTPSKSLANQTDNPPHSFQVLYNGAVIGNSQVVQGYVYPGAVAGSAVTFTGASDARVAGDVFNMTVFSRDQFNNRRWHVSSDASAFGVAFYRTSDTAPGSVFVPFFPLGNGRYTVAMRSTRAGVHTVSVSANGVALPSNNPVNPTINPAATDGTKTTVLYGTTAGGYVGEVKWFVIQAYDTYGNPVQTSNDAFSVSTPAGTGSIGVLGQTGQYNLTYTNPSQTGKYNILVSWTPPGGSSQVVLTLPAEAIQPLAGGTKAYATGYSTTVAGVAGSFVVYDIDPNTNVNRTAQAFLKVTIRLADSATQPDISTGITVNFNAASNTYTYVVNYIGTVAGTYTIRIFFNLVTESTATVGYPASFKIVPGAVSGPLSVITGLPAQLTAGTNSTFEIELRDVYNNPYTTGGLSSHLIAQWGLGTTDARLTILDLNDGSYLVNYTATVAGDKGVTLLYDSTILGSSSTPYLVTVSPAALSASATTVSGPGLSGVTAGGTTTLTITPKDAFGNQLSTSGLQFWANLSADGVIFSTTTTSFTNGLITYTLPYSASKAGPQQLTVSSGVAPSLTNIGGSPFPVTINPTSVDPSKCTVTGLGAQSAGVPFTVTIVARDSYNNLAADLSLLMQFQSPDESGSVSATQTTPGTYTVTYTARKIGTYTPTISVLGASASQLAIPTSNGLVTFAVNAGTTVPSRSNVGALLDFVAGTLQNFTIQTQDNYGNPINLFTDIIAVKFIKGKAQCGLIIDPANPENKIQAPAPVFSSDFVFGVFQTSVGGQYAVRLSSTVAGFFSANITVNGFPVYSDCNQFPTFSVLPGVANSTYTQVKGFFSSVAGTTNTIGIFVKDKYGNSRTQGGDTVALGVAPTVSTYTTSLPASTWVSASNGFVVSDTTDKQDGTYAITYSGTVTGSFPLIVTVNGELVPNISIAAVTPGPIASFSDFTVPSVTAAIPASFQLQGLDAYGNTVVSTAHTYSVTYTRNHPDSLNSYNFRCSVAPVSLGVHTISLTSEWHGDAKISINLVTGGSVTSANATRSKALTALHATCGFESGFKYRCPFDRTCTNTPRGCDAGSLGSFCNATTPVLCSNGQCAATLAACGCGSLKYCATLDACMVSLLSCPKQPTQCPSFAPIRCAGSGVCRASAADCPSQPVCNLGYYLCPDGISCAKSYSSCTTNPGSICFALPHGTIYTCTDGSCVKSLDDCPTRTSCGVGQVVCPDGSCQASVDDCPSSYDCNAPNTYRCPDGSCRGSLADCPSRRVCPPGWVRCENGHCAVAVANCSVSAPCSFNRTRCPDGSCAHNLLLCPTGTTCPSSLPVLCPDGSCASEAAFCRAPTVCGFNQTQCPDGSCVNYGVSCMTRRSCPTQDASYSVLCPDGSCVAHQSDCSVATSGVCPDYAPLRCPDGSCRKRRTDCPSTISCPANKPIRCGDGRCQTAPDSMCVSPSLLTCGSGQVRCPSGGCANSPLLCPTTHTCPSNTTMCYDGSCRTADSPCPTENSRTFKPECPVDQVTCPRFGGAYACASSLAQCPQGVVCPVDRPVRCHDATCAASLGGCPPVPSDWVSNRFLCPDGSWTNSILTCGTASTCPSHTPYKCWDDTCRKVPSDCPAQIKCPATAPHLCPSGQCVPYMDSCRSGTYCPSATPVKCPNQQCVTDAESCADWANPQSTDNAQYASLPCSNNYFRCRNGLCVSDSSLCTGMTCPSHLPKLCEVGVCVGSEDTCPDPTTGCPTYIPYKCWDGQCVTDVSRCTNDTAAACTTGETRCWDGSCVTRATDCPPTNGCNSGERRCWDKSCSDSRSENMCISSTPQRDGNHNGCPFNYPFLCPDGQCMISSAHCIRYPLVLPSPCPAARPVLCADGTCVKAGSQCPIILPCGVFSTGESRCGDGSCRNPLNGDAACPGTDNGHCPSGWVRCKAALSGRAGSGRCARQASDCPVLTTGCPSGQSKCAGSGLCVDTANVGSCSTAVSANGCQGTPSTPYKCPNGGCAASAIYCDQLNGCPATAPFRCANGTCVTNSPACGAATTCTQTLCANGDCVASADLCKTVTGCSISTPVRCADGSCKKYAAFTYNDTSLSVWALNQSSNACTTVMQCPASAPYLCADKSCAINSAFCKVVHACPGVTPYLCSDLSCAANAAACALDSSNSCPPARPLRCASGACVKSIADCAFRVKASCSAGQVECFDGSCKSSFQECIKLQAAISGRAWDPAANHDNSTCADLSATLCGNGACVLAASLCPPVPRCPNSAPLRCLDGSCTNSTCPTLDACGPTLTRCADGTCRPAAKCPATFGCPTSAPLYCPDTGKCLASTTVLADCRVSGTNTQQVTGVSAHVRAQVVDTTTLGCTDNCYRDLVVSSLTVTVNPYTTSDTQTVTFAVDGNNTAVSTLQVLSGSLVPISGNLASVSISPVADSVILNSIVKVDQYRLGVYSATLSKAQLLLSPPFQCSVDANTQQPFPVPLYVVGTLDRAVSASGDDAYSNDPNDVCLGFYDATTGEWNCNVGNARANRVAAPGWNTSYGLEVNQAQGYITTCTDRTIYAFILNPLPGVPPTIPPDEASFAEKNKGAIIGGVVGAACFVVIALYVGWRLYRYRGKYHQQREARKQAEETIEEMQIVGSQATAEEDDIAMTPNPLVLRMDQLAKELDTKDKALDFNRKRSTETSDPHVTELQAERDALASELAKLKAQLEFERMSAQTGGVTGSSSSPSNLSFGVAPPPQRFQPPPLPPAQSGGGALRFGSPVASPEGVQLSNVGVRPAPQSFAPPPLPSGPSLSGVGSPAFTSQYSGPALPAASTGFQALQPRAAPAQNPNMFQGQQQQRKKDF